MNHYLEVVKFTELAPMEVQHLLVCFIENTQPNQLRNVPYVCDYSDTTIFYNTVRIRRKQSISVDFFLKNLTTRQQYNEFINYNDLGILQKKSGNITYIDSDIMKPCHFSMIIRMDSINRLLSGGIHEFLKHAKWGATNGRLFIMAEMRDHPSELLKLFDDFLQPNGFIERQDFVWGYCEFFSYSDYYKPLPSCVVPWLESYITPWGKYVRFKETEKNNKLWKLQNTL